MTMENTPISPELEKLLSESKPLSEITDANSHCPDAFGSLCDDDPCHECGAEMEGRESYLYENECDGDESWLCQECHDS